MDEQYEILIKNVNRFKKGVRFTISDVVLNPQAHVGRMFAQAVLKGDLPNVKSISTDGQADEYEIVS